MDTRPCRGHRAGRAHDEPRLLAVATAGRETLVQCDGDRALGDQGDRDANDLILSALAEARRGLDEGEVGEGEHDADDRRDDRRCCGCRAGRIRVRTEHRTADSRRREFCGRCGHAGGGGSLQDRRLGQSYRHHGTFAGTSRACIHTSDVYSQAARSTWSFAFASAETGHQLGEQHLSLGRIDCGRQCKGAAIVAEIAGFGIVDISQRRHARQQRGPAVGGAQESLAQRAYRPARRHEDQHVGQRQRIGIARALSVEPEVLLMDEPCSALDPGSTLRIEDTIKELAADMTIVIVTHNMQQASRISDYTAFFLSDGGPGQMVEVGATADIFSRPQDKRTEDYVSGRFG